MLNREQKKLIAERIRELKKEQKDIKNWKMSKEMKEQQRIIGKHRIDEAEYLRDIL